LGISLQDLDVVGTKPFPAAMWSALFAEEPKLLLKKKRHDHVS
jgi:hypothetical protein